MLSFGDKIREARKLKRLTQKQLAEIIGAKHNSVSDWENDKNKPDPDTIELICGILEISANYLLGTKDPTESISPEAIEIALAYDKADIKDKNIIRIALGLELKTISPHVEYAGQLYMDINGYMNNPKQKTLGIKVYGEDDNFNEEPYKYEQLAAENRSEYRAAANADEEITQEELDEAVLQTLKASKKHNNK